MPSISKLKNGLKVVKIPMLGTKAVTIMVMLPVGSRYENIKINGVSHFVEHMMFKGTKKRPTALKLSRELDAFGAEYNAFTSKDYTGYYIKISKEKFAVAADLLSDMLFNSKMEEEEFKKEKGVIIEEIRMYDDNPTMSIDSLFEKVLFGDTSLGRDIAGTEKIIKELKHKELVDYYQGSYFTKNMVLAVVGNLDKNCNKLIKKYFDVALNNKTKKWFNVDNFEKISWPKKKLPLEKRILVKQKKIDQAHVIMGFPGYKIKDDRRHIGAVLLNILGGGMSSRLFVEVREKRGLAYMVRASNEAFRDIGSVYIQTGLDPKRLKDAFSVIKDELKKISKIEVEDKELKDAKNNLIGHLALALEDGSVQAMRAVRGLLFTNKIETYEEIVKKIRAVSAKQILSLAREIFREDQMRLAVISPLTEKEIIKMLK